MSRVKRYSVPILKLEYPALHHYIYSLPFAKPEKAITYKLISANVSSLSEQCMYQL